MTAATAVAENPRAVPGDNKPPGPIEIAVALTKGELSTFLEQHPIIEKHEDAIGAAKLIDRARKAAAEIEDERKAKVDPLNKSVKAINAEYHAVHNEDGKKPGSLDKIIVQLKTRQTAFLNAEEARKAKIAEDARLAAIAAEKALAEAAEREREALDNAAAGEFAAGVGTAIAEAADAEAEAAKLARQAVIAERDVTTRIATPFGRSQVLRTHEVPAVANHVTALMTLWSDDKLKLKLSEAIISAAREWKRDKGAWPKGISITNERRL